VFDYILRTHFVILYNTTGMSHLTVPRECHGNNKYLRRPENLLEFRIQNKPPIASLTRCSSQLARHSWLSITENSRYTNSVSKSSLSAYLGLHSPSGPTHPHCWGSAITLGHTTLGTSPLDDGSAHRKDIYLTTHNIHNRQRSMPPARFELAMPAGKRPQTRA